jgi:hypothetical protein
LNKKAKVKASGSEIALNYGMIVSGIIMTIVGVAISVLKQVGKL